MDSLYWILGVSVVSLGIEKFFEMSGKNDKANYIGMVSNFIIFLFIVRMIYSLLDEIRKMFGLM